MSLDFRCEGRDQRDLVESYLLKTRSLEPYLQFHCSSLLLWSHHIHIFYQDPIHKLTKKGNYDGD